MKNKFIKFGVVKGDQVPGEINELENELEKLPDLIADEIRDAMKDDKDPKDKS